MTAITQLEIDQHVFDLYDEYCHGRIDRREFLRARRRAGRGGAGDGAGAAAELRAGADHFLHRHAHQGELRDLSVAGRQRATRCAATWCSRRATGRCRRCW